MDKFRNHKGAISIEYALIFPLVVLCLYFIIYLGLLYYQQSVLQSIAGESIRNWAYMWGNDTEIVNVETGIEGRKGYESEGLYWQIFSDTKNKKAGLMKDIKMQITEKSMMKPTDIDIDVSYHNFLIVQKVSVHITTIYPSPAGHLFQTIGWSGEVLLETHCETVLSDPKEFIHNTDYLLQIYEETGVGDWVKKKCEPLTESLRKIKKYFQ